MIAAVIPIKAFALGKSRLSPAVEPDARAALAEQMFTRIVTLAAEVFDAVFVVTLGEGVAAIARARGAVVVPDPPDVKGLADVVDAGLAAAAEAGASTGVVLMADLPRVEAADLRALRAACARAPVVVVPDHRGRHTNALALTPPDRFPTCFGHPESLAEHIARGGPETLRLPNRALALDVDLVDDLAHAEALGG